jgi:hypothetical protein
MTPDGLKLSVTDQFDVPPRPRIKLVEWHLTAATSSPQTRAEFVTLIRVHRPAQPSPSQARLEAIPNGYAVEAKLAEGRVLALWRTGGSQPLRFKDMTVDSDLAAVRFDNEGRQLASFASDRAATR